MRTFIFPVFLGCFLMACSGGTEEDTTSTSEGSIEQSELSDTCMCMELLMDTLGNHTLNGAEYTGVCVEYFPNSSDRYIEKNLLNGKLHGKITYFDRSGEVLLEEIYDGGEQKRSGKLDVLMCDCSELELLESNMPLVPNRFLLDDIPYTGTCEKYYAAPDTNQMYMSASYEDGLLHGRVVYYNKDGSTLLIERYEKGEQVSAVH